MADIIIKTIQLKRGTAQAWQKNNLILKSGEPGFELDTNKLKIGDGATAWNNLPYFGETTTIEGDNKSISIVDNIISLFNFDKARTNSYLRKSKTNELEWVSIDLPLENIVIELNNLKHIITNEEGTGLVEQLSNLIQSVYTKQEIDDLLKNISVGEINNNWEDF